MRWKKGAKIGTNVRPFAVDCAMGAPGERKKKGDRRTKSLAIDSN
jgi:hypothetical protein